MSKKTRQELTVGSIVEESITIFKKEWSFLIAVCLFFAVWFVAGYQIQMYVNSMSLNEYVVIGLQVCVEMITLFLLYGVTYILLSLVRGKQGTYRMLIASMYAPQNFLSYIVGMILLAVLFYIGFMIYVVPGIIVGIFFGFVRFIIVDQHVDPLTAFWYSMKYTWAFFVPVVLLFLACIALNIVGALMLGFGLLVSVPLTLITYTLLYVRVAEHYRMLYDVA